MLLEICSLSPIYANAIYTTLRHFGSRPFVLNNTITVLAAILSIFCKSKETERSVCTFFDFKTKKTEKKKLNAPCNLLPFAYI